MCFTLAYFGKLFENLARLIFGEEGSWIGITITIAALLVIVYILLKVDWEEIFEKYAGKRRLRTE